MISLNLDLEEQQALMDVLEVSISEIHHEILHTEARDFKECLKNRKQVLMRMLNHMRETQSAVMGD